MSDSVNTSSLQMQFKVEPQGDQVKLALLAIFSPDIGESLLVALAAIRDGTIANDEYYEQIRAFWASLRDSVEIAGESAPARTENRSRKQGARRWLRGR